MCEARCESFFGFCACILKGSMVAEKGRQYTGVNVIFLVVIKVANTEGLLVFAAETS